MKTRLTMHLVEDGVHTFGHGERTIDVRIRIWMKRESTAVALVESAPGRRAQNVRTWAPRIGTYLHHVAFRGDRTFCYVERSGAYDSERWDLVAFETVRHLYCDPTRRRICRATVEAYVGSSV